MTQFNICLCCVTDTMYVQYLLLIPSHKKSLSLWLGCVSFLVLYWALLIDWFGATHGQPSKHQWISEFWADTPTATNSITIILHTHKLSASQLKKPTDRPHSTLPGQICNLSAGKHAGGLKVEEPSIWSRYNSHCSVCSTWAHFTLQRTGESIWAPRWKTWGTPAQSPSTSAALITWGWDQADRANRTESYDAHSLCVCA